MKPLHYNSIHIILVFSVLFILCGCSSEQTPEQLLKRVMEQRGKTKFNVPFSQKWENEKLIFSWVQENDSNVGIDIVGTVKMTGDYLIVTLEEGEYDPMQNNNYSTGFFKQSENGWKSLFSSELIYGRLDTLIDLNNDNQNELIVDEYNSTSSGYDNYKVLYAKVNDGYVKIDTICRDGMPSGMVWYGISSIVSYDRINDSVVINVVTTDPHGDATGESTEISNYSFSWQPPKLVLKQNEKRDGSGLLDLAIQVSHLRPMPYDSLMKLLKEAEITLGFQFDKMAKIGGYYVILGELFFEDSDGSTLMAATYTKGGTLVSVNELGIPKRKINLGDSIEYNIEGIQNFEDDLIRIDLEIKYSLDKSNIKSNQTMYFKLVDKGKLERILWNNNWNSLDTLSMQELILLRNDVFARHGYIFKSTDLTTYFNVFRNYWYYPTSNEVNDKLTAEEKRFVEYIKKLEDSKVN